MGISCHLEMFHVKPTGIQCVVGLPSLSRQTSIGSDSCQKKSALILFIGAAEFLGDKHNAKLWCTRDMRVYSFLEFDGFLRIGM